MSADYHILGEDLGNYPMSKIAEEVYGETMDYATVFPTTKEWHQMMLLASEGVQEYGDAYAQCMQVLARARNMSRSGERIAMAAY